MKDWKYVLYVGGAIALFVFVRLIAPKQYDWTVTFAHDDKNPYGAYALSELLPALFTKENINHSYQTLYELKDSLKQEGNFLIISSTFSPEKEDVHALLNHLEQGGKAFISAEYFYGLFSDTLKVVTNDYLFNSDPSASTTDSSYLKLSNRVFDSGQEYWYERDNIHRYFQKFDSTKTTVVARNDYGRAVTIRMKWGKGDLILNSTPLIFTNIYLLSKNNHDFIAKTLSHLPDDKLQWTEFYHLGRMESATPLRFILTNEPLRWAYYLTLLAIVIFMVFEMKRRQRIIPVIAPLANTTLEFVSTIGNLYYQNGNHKNIAEKKIIFLFEYIRSKYLLQTNYIDENFMKALALKSGKSQEDILSLFRTISFIQKATVISPEQLMDLNSKIENFNARK
jgi:hypothetical protein